MFGVRNARSLLGFGILLFGISCTVYWECREPSSGEKNALMCFLPEDWSVSLCLGCSVAGNWSFAFFRVELPQMTQIE
jgi:hypothetical protein